MKFWSFSKGLGYKHLKLCTAECPKPQTGEVLLEMAVASLNYRDLVVLRGQHGKHIQPPLIPLSDGVGRIIAVGDGVVDLKVGQRVCPAFYPNWQAGDPQPDLRNGALGGPSDGVLASHRIFRAEACIPVPDHLSDEEAATLPCAGVTAWNALTQPRAMVAGQSVVIQGSGGVALAALQFAKHMGLEVIMTSSSPEKCRKLKVLGADHVIDRSVTSDWEQAVLDLTKGVGCDRVLELGGADSFTASLKAVRIGGVIVPIGTVTGMTAPLFLPAMLTRRVTLHAVSCGSVADFKQMIRAISLHRTRFEVERCFAFSNAIDAFRALEKGGHMGNICVSCHSENED